MEIKALRHLYGPIVDFAAGETSIGKNMPEEEKQRLITTFPEWFEVIVADELVVETPEDGLEIETPEAKMGKTRKK